MLERDRRIHTAKMLVLLLWVASGACAHAVTVTVEFAGGWTQVPSLVRDNFGDLFDQPFGGTFTYDTEPIIPGTFTIIDSTLVFGDGVAASLVPSTISFANQVRYSSSDNPFIDRESYGFTLAVDSSLLPDIGRPYLFSASIEAEDVFEEDDPPFRLPFLLESIDEPRGPEMTASINVIGNANVGGVIGAIAIQSIVPEPPTIFGVVLAVLLHFALGHRQASFG